MRGRGGGGGGRPGVDRVRDGVLLVPRPSWMWTFSCDHAATSSAVLYTISDRRGGGASASVQRQSVLPRCEQRQLPTVAVFQPWFRGVAVH